MSVLRKLAGETAIYGLTTILGRLLNYLLVPIHTRIFVNKADYGIVTEVYAWVGFLIIMFGYRMETAFFRFGREATDRKKTFWTAVNSLAVSTILLSGGLTVFSADIAAWLGYPQYGYAIACMAWVIGLDAICSVPFAWLRLEGKAKEFGFIKLVNIGVNIGANLIFLLLFPLVGLYSEEIGIGYIFIANLMASLVTLLMLIPVFRRNLPEGSFNFRKEYSPELWKKMMRYALPLVAVGFAGMVNEVLDRAILKYLLDGPMEERLAQVGIYGACYKLSILMTLFTQAFNYAYEPFFFKHAEREDAKNINAQVAKAFALVGCVVFLGVMLYLDIVQYFIGERYREGMGIVPILLLANLFLGLYYTVSAWYKVTDNTMIGAWISLGGALVTIVTNLVLVPFLGYFGSAWATLACYFIMLIVCWRWGQKYYPVPYQPLRIAAFIFIAIGTWQFAEALQYQWQMDLFPKLIINTAIFLLFIAYLMKTENIDPVNLLGKRKPNLPQ